MKLPLQRLLVMSVVLSLISGCATTDGGRTREEGTGFGALLGAAVGAGLGAVIGGKNGALIGTGVGAVVGAGAGYVAGDAVADKKEAYVKKENHLDSRINSVVQYNSDLREYNEQTAARIADLDTEVAQLKSRYKSKEAQIDELTTKKDEINFLISASNERKTKMKKEVVALNQYMKTLKTAQGQAQAQGQAKAEAKVKMAKLGQEVAALKKNIADLDTNNKQMAKLVNTLSVRK